MIYHISFAVRRPEHVAKVLAELTGATPVRAPTPPFPADSWLLCHGDGNGSLIELLPWRSVLHPNEPLEITVVNARAWRAHAPESLDELVDCTAFVNQRYVANGQAPPLHLVVCADAPGAPVT